MPVIIRFLAFPGCHSRLGCGTLESGRSPYFIAFVALWHSGKGGLGLRGYKVAFPGLPVGCQCIASWGPVADADTLRADPELLQLRGELVLAHGFSRPSP